jgi:hypothetical protein
MQAQPCTKFRQWLHSIILKFVIGCLPSLKEHVIDKTSSFSYNVFRILSYKFWTGFEAINSTVFSTVNRMDVKCIPVDF